MYPAMETRSECTGHIVAGHWICNHDDEVWIIKSLPRFPLWPTENDIAWLACPHLQHEATSRRDGCGARMEFIFEMGGQLAELDGKKAQIVRPRNRTGLLCFCDTLGIESKLHKNLPSTVYQEDRRVSPTPRRARAHVRTHTARGHGLVEQPLVVVLERRPACQA